MKKRTKFEIMSECLAQFKEVPHILENLEHANIQENLKNLLKCSNKFV